MDPSTSELFSFDVVHVPRQKIHSLEEWSAPAYRREVLAQLRSETGKTLSRVRSEGGASTGLHDLDGFEDCASDDGVGCEGEGSGDEEAAASSLRAAKISERDLFGGSNGSDNSDDEASDGVPDYVPAIMAHKYARLNQKKRAAFPTRKKQKQQPAPKPLRSAPAVKRSQSAMSKGSASTSSGHSDKTAALSSKRMRTVLGYDETAGGARRSKRPASMMDARAVVMMDEEVERQAIASVSGVFFKLGRAPRVTYRSAADA